MIGWYFHATLRQPFDYRQFPFDRQDVWLRLWHPDLGRNTLLVPDFGSYTDMKPSAQPGLERHFVYEGRDPELTSFNDYTTSFGLGREQTLSRYPELYYDIGLKRDFLSPLLDDALSLTVIGLLLFATLRPAATDEAREQRLDLPVGPVMSFCGVVLFGVNLTHNHIRSSVSPQQIAYLETIPFPLYLGMLSVALNTILLSMPVRPKRIVYEDNLIPKLLFWPTMLGSLLVLTLVILVA